MRRFFVGVTGSDVLWYQTTSKPRWSEEGTSGPLAEDDGFQRFDVPEGPALFEYAPGGFVYSSASRLEPCELAIRDAEARGDAGVEVDVTLSQPAAAGDTLEVMSSLLPFFGERLLELDAGSTTIVQRVPWRGRPVLAGNTTVVHHVEALPYDGFTRTTTVGVLDAGILDQFGEATVALRGAFEPVPAGGYFTIGWDGASLDSLQNQEGEGPLVSPFRPVFTALRGALPLASTWTDGRRNTRIPLVMPALEPDSFTVSGLIPLGPDGLLAMNPGFRIHFYAVFAWHGPWTDSPEMSAKQHPAREVRIAADGASVSWAPPALAPGLYEVHLLARQGAQFQRVALIMTDQATVPIPRELRRTQIMAQVTALYGPGLSEETCAQHEHLASWARLPAGSDLWMP